MAADTAAENAEKPADKKDWLAGHIAYLSKLKSPNDEQRLLLLLAEKKERDAKEERTFAALVKSEKALERAKKARAEVAGLLADEKKKAAEAERKARTQKLIKLGLIFGYAGLDEAPRDFLAGLAAFGARMDKEMVEQVRRLGATVLLEKEPEKAAAKSPASQAPSAQSAPAPAPAPRPAPAPEMPQERAPETVSTRTYLVINVDDMGKVKSLGARLDVERQQWYVPPGIDLRHFAHWIGVDSENGI